MEEGEMRHKLEIRLHHEGIKRSTALEKKNEFHGKGQVTRTKFVGK